MAANPSDQPEPNIALIAVDWGTSSFRAYRLNRTGEIVDRLSDGGGIMSVRNGLFEQALADRIGHWSGDGSQPPPVLMSGMIGSRQGWVEADYIEPPASLADIAESLSEVPRRGLQSVHIVPGMSTSDGTMPDVMRGEETQIFGAMDRHALRDGTFVLPGTHSKWVQAGDGAITKFTSFMTGEVFAALCGHTILGAFMGEQTGTDENGFRRGLDAGYETGSPGALLHRIFGARTHALFGTIETEAVADYLSGVLIGAEFAEASRNCRGTLWIIGTSDLAGRYLLAADHVGLSAECIDPDCTAAGLYAIAGTAGLVDQDS